MLIKIEKIILKEKPDSVLVYGDTNSTLAGALSASKLHIPVIHIEAGLRSYNKRMPEEINRILTDHVSTLLFTPSEVGMKNLKNEGITKAYNVGDVMYDAVIQNIKIAEKLNKFAQFGLKEKDYCLVTVHRAENTDEKNRLEQIVQGLEQIKSKIIWPLP